MLFVPVNFDEDRQVRVYRQMCMVETWSVDYLPELRNDCYMLQLLLIKNLYKKYQLVVYIHRMIVYRFLFLLVSDYL